MLSESYAEEDIEAVLAEIEIKSFLSKSQINTTCRGGTVFYWLEDERK